MSDPKPLLVKLRGLTIETAERTLIRGVDVDVYAQAVTALCGPSGSGKSLTARAPCVCWMWIPALLVAACVSGH